MTHCLCTVSTGMGNYWQSLSRFYAYKTSKNYIKNLNTDYISVMSTTTINVPIHKVFLQQVLYVVPYNLPGGVVIIAFFIQHNVLLKSTGNLIHFTSTVGVITV